MGASVGVGDMAPDFELSYPGGNLRLSTLRGQKVVLYFFPQSFTGGCTTEACGMRDAFPKFGDANAAVVAVSVDDLPTQLRFTHEYKLPFPVLADEGGEVSSRYGVFGITRKDGSKLDQARRVTFLIDEQGRVVKVFDPVDPAKHADEVSAAIAELETA